MKFKILGFGNVKKKGRTIIIHSRVERNRTYYKYNMAASFPNMNITNSLKELVSKRRNRYKKNGFNLDLTYITDNVIAMGYPASNIEGVFRNHIDDVVKFLEFNHKDRYWIYNLCSERNYDKSKFHNRVATFGFNDHSPPKIEIIHPFCESVYEWLSGNEENVAVVHCKAGKGRTGTMICCYLLFSRMFGTADEALRHYGQTRTQDKKGVTIPSQMRYVRYYEKLIKNNLIYVPVSMYVREIVLQPLPLYPQGSTLYFKLYKHGVNTEQQQCLLLHKSEHKCDLKKGENRLVIPMNVCVPLTGDVKVEFVAKSLILPKSKFHFWFNTFFVKEEATSVNGIVEQNGGRNSEKSYLLTFKKNEIDTINKSKQHKVYSSDFQVTLFLQKIPTNEASKHNYVCEIPPQQQETPSESSESSSEESNEEDGWESGESTHL